MPLSTLAWSSWFTRRSRDKNSARRQTARRRRVGRRGEQAAVRYLRRRGLRILARNVYCAGGEIDIVALEGETLVFVEVKARTAASRAEGMQRVDARKRRALRKACLGYLRSTAEPVEHFRVDGVAVDLEWRRFGLRVLDVSWERGLFSLIDDDAWDA